MTKVVRKTATATAEVGATTAQIEAEGMTVNRAGGPAFKQNDYTALVSYLTTGGAGGTFYATKQALDNEAKALFTRFADRDPGFLARAIIYARTKGLMRTAPITALVTLSAGGTDAKRMFHAAFADTIQTPGDLQDFWKLLRGTSKTRGVGRAIRSETNAYLAGLTPYHAIKYGSNAQGFALRDIYRLSRPTLTGPAAATARYIVKGELTEDTPAQLRGYHAFKNATADIDTLLGMVAEHRLPWEVVSGQLGGGDAAEKKQVWTAMAAQMPYMALLRNVANLIRSGALDEATTRVSVLGKLRDPNNVAHSKQLPFRFISAIRAIEALPRGTGYSNAVISETIDALKKALDYSVSNMPASLGHTLTVLDVSGSMSSPVSGEYHSRGGFARTGYSGEQIRCVDVGAIFAAALYKGTGGEVMTFDTSVQWETNKLHRDMAVYDIANSINRAGGGTALHAAVQSAFTSGKKFDAMVFITDSESWADEMRSGGWHRRTGENASSALLRTYREKIHEGVKVFFLQLVPTETTLVTPDTANTYYISGWSNSVLDYITLQMDTDEGQLDAIRAITL